MGGIDKGLQPYQGMPLARHALQQLAPQVGTVWINANRNRASYEAFGVPVCADATDEFAGPLAGFLAGLACCQTDFLVTVPCDTPNFPPDLVARLASGLEREAADLAMVRCVEPDAEGAGPRAQPVFCLLRTSLADSLRTFLHDGGRKIDRWTAQHRVALVDFAEADAFFNANTLADLHELETRRG